MAIESLNLIHNLNRVETPFIRVTIGDYVFGAFERYVKNSEESGYGTEVSYGVRFPNFITDLDIVKINGEVNTYTLRMVYTIRETDDPNFLERVFSSVAKSRKIVFSYGDMCIPSYYYKDEEAIITKVQSSINMSTNTINYTVSAVSSAKLADVASFPYFPPFPHTKPSTVIKQLFTEPQYAKCGLYDLFPGMRNGTTLNGVKLIPDDDIEVDLETKTNITVLDYLKYLVSMMTPISSSDLMNNPYIIIFGDDTSGELMGPYFQIIETNSNVKNEEAYVIDVGFTSDTLVTDFRIEDDETYSIFYDFQQQLSQEEDVYVERLNNRGEVEEVYAPTISSGNIHFHTKESDKSWWTAVTNYPIKASLTVKGLLKPALLMSYVRVNVLFFGKKHISSGLYIVTKQQDSIGASGFKTTLGLLRVSGDDDEQ